MTKDFLWRLKLQVGNWNEWPLGLRSGVKPKLTHSLTAALDQLRVVASSTSNDPGPRSRQHQQIGQQNQNTRKNLTGTGSKKITMQSITIVEMNSTQNTKLQT